MALSNISLAPDCGTVDVRDGRLQRQANGDGIILEGRFEVLQPRREPRATYPHASLGSVLDDHRKIPNRFVEFALVFPDRPLHVVTPDVLFGLRWIWSE